MITVYPAQADQYNMTLIAGGKIAGKTPTRVLGRHPGINNVLTDVGEFIAAGSLYVFPPSPIQMRVVSSSANDAAAGTGVRTIELDYLDTNYAAQSETVTLNGVTPVNTVATNILRVNNVHTMTTGTGLVAAGNIQVQNTAGSVVYRQVSAGFNVDLTTVFTVPAGKKYFISAVNGSEGTAAGTHFTQFFLRMTANEEGVLTAGIFQIHDAFACLNNGIDTEYSMPLLAPAQADVKITAVSDAGGASAVCTAHFSGWLENA